MSLPPDDDRTMLSPGNIAASPADEHAHGGALEVGTRLGEFEITGVLGKGGFGIVYLAHDGSLEREVALKEYMPSFAYRSTQARVSVMSAQNADSFEAGLRSFINEARMLAQFDHPSLVKVYRFWEANGTAYMVMPYYRGATLKQALLERPGPPDEAWLKAMLAPLLDALEVIHDHHCFHRDIAPDNILMLDEGRPLLLDFGAARRAIGDQNQAFTVILKQNYAPIEQYAEMPGMSQGAWTDLYALASVVHFAIDGHAPPAAVGRLMSDPYVPLVTRYAGQFSKGFLEAIDRALAFRPEHRPQSVAEMRALLGLEAAAPQQTGFAPTPASRPSGRSASKSASQHSSGPVPTAGTPPAVGGRRRRLLGAGLAAAVLAGAGAYAFLNQEKEPPAVQLPQAAGEAPGVAKAPVASVAPVAPVRPAATPFDPVAALDAIVAGASPARTVTVDVPTRRARIGVDKLGFSIRSSHAGYVYVHIVGTRGNDFLLLFPNAFDPKNRIQPGEMLSLPRPSWPIRALGPPGTDHFVVMVSDMPRDFSSAGLAEGSPFSSFSMARAASLQRDYRGASPLFAGVPVCTTGSCPAAYGAAAFTIDETTP